MKKNGKKLLSLLLVLVMLLSLAPSAFAGELEVAASEDEGFGSEWESWEDEVPEEPAPAEEPAEDPAPAEEPVEEPAPVVEIPEIEEPAPVEESIVEEQTAPVEEPVVEEEPVEISYPADTFYYVGGSGLRVTVDAPEGAFPENTEMNITEIRPENVQKTVNDAGVEGKVLVAADISFVDADGNELQPNFPVDVCITSVEAARAQTVKVVHIDDDNNVSEVDQITDMTLQASASIASTDSVADAMTLRFEANSFSVYAIVEGDDIVTHQITYHFLDGEDKPYRFLNTAGETVSTQIIKNGEALQEVPAPGLLNNQAFNGWYYYDKDTKEYGAEVKFGEPITVTETKDVYIKAHYGNVIYVTFWQYAAGRVVLERKQLAVNESTGTASMDMRDVTVPAPKTTLKFMGWSLTAGTDASEEGGDTPGSRALLDNGTVEFTQDTDVYPVYYNGLWIVFVSAQTGMGADYVPGYFITADSSSAAAAEPTAPTMTGYTFDGWYTEAEPVEDYTKTETQSSHGEEFDFNTSFEDLANYVNPDTGEVILYGHWKPGTTSYVVVYWKQQVGNDKNATDAQKTYDYAGQTDPINAQTGSVPQPSSQQQAADVGFQYSRAELVDVKDDGTTVASTGIKADGSSVLNVYFDRITITMRFYKTAGSVESYYGYTYYEAPQAYNANRWTNTLYTDIYTGLYGQTWSQAGYSHDWPSPGNGNYWVCFNSAYTDESSRTVWMYQGNVQGTIMTYLGQFILPDGIHDSTGVDIRLFKIAAQTSTVSYFLQNTDGTYPTSTTITGAAPASGTFSFSDKYEGFKVASYRLGNGQWQTVSSTTNSDGSHTYTPASIEVNGNLSIRYERLPYEIKYLNPLNEKPVLAAQQKLFGASLSSAKPTATEIDLGVPGYEWDGKWYKDKNCTVEFNFDTEVMPLGGTKVYAGKTPLYFFIKIDPNGGVLQTGQATWRWVRYGDDTTYTYDNITRDYMEYKGSGTAYYYYYDEFDVSRRDDIWNYEYMASNPRTARYITDASQIPAGGGSAWLGTEKFSPEPDAYTLIGWYDVTDGGMTPFKSGTAITRDTIIQAQWRRTGEYTVVYSVEAVDETGAALMKDDARVVGANSPVDGAKYADMSDSAIMDKMGVIPAGYNFVGWFYNGQVYQPGDVFQVLARLSDDNKIVHIYPVLEPVETLPVEVINITFDPNGGAFTDKADTELQAMIAEVTGDETGSYAPEIVTNEDGTKTINNLKLNEGLTLLTGEAVANGVEVNGEKVLGRGYRLKEWNTKADGTGTSFSLDAKIGVDEKDPIPNVVYAIWEEVFYVYHPATKKFEVLLKGDTTNRWELTTGFDPAGTVNKTQYTSYYYGGFSVFAAGNAEAAGLTFANGEVKSGTIADTYWVRSKAAKSGDAWNSADTGAVYFLKEVPTSYLAKPVAITIRDDYGKGDITSLHFLSVTDTSIYRQGGIKLKGTDKKGSFATSFKLSQNNGSTTTITSQSQFSLPGYLTVVNGGTESGAYTACQAYWVTYDSVTVYGIEANIKDITIN